MKTTLYEVLEVSENASKEVIEKAYKVLAKKYHPDLQTSENKQMADKKMKEINEAYDILRDDLKRKSYDEKLKNEREIERKLNIQETTDNSSQMTEEEQKYRQMQRKKYEEELLRRQRQMEQNMQEQYENAYYQYLRSLGYRIKESWTWEKTKKLFLTIAIMTAILLVLWIFPPTHKIMLNVYEGNAIIKVIVDIVLGIIEAFFKAIGSGFQSLFNGW